LFALVYLATLAFDKKHTFYKYQQGILILTLSLILSQFAMILLFLYGFLGGSVASAISRLHISGYVGKISAIGIVVVFLIVFFKLILDLLEISK